MWPQASHQRCWNHKILNVLDDLPKRVQGKARALLTQIPSAATRQEAEKRRTTFARRYRDRYPQAVATLERDWERMVTFYDFPQGALETPAHNQSGREPLCFGTLED